MLRRQSRVIVNGFLSRLGLCIVNRQWGPRGFAASLRKAKTKGVIISGIVDVGAARGEWTQECLTVFPEADYFLVDPLQENEPHLATLRDRCPNVAYWIGAVGARAEEKPFFVHGDQLSFLVSEYASNEKAAVRSVKLETLDFVVGEHLGRWPQLVKADVQGAELHVLQGAERCLKNAELVLLEVSFQTIYQEGTLAHEVISYLGARDFRIYDICTYSQRPLDRELAQADILFARAGSVLFADAGWG